MNDEFSLINTLVNEEMIHCWDLLQDSAYIHKNRYYVIDQDGDIIGLEPNHHGGLPNIHDAMQLATKIRVVHSRSGITVGQPQMSRVAMKDGRLHSKWVWERLWDADTRRDIPIEKTEPPYADFGSW